MSLLVPDAQSKMSRTWHDVIAPNPTAINQSNFIKKIIPADLVIGNAQ
jgi:hypothetical protein